VSGLPGRNNHRVARKVNAKLPRISGIIGLVRVRAPHLHPSP
jgi:hypothetical protein